MVLSLMIVLERKFFGYQWQPIFKINVIYNIDINILANKCLKIMRGFKTFPESLLSLLISWFYMKLELSVKQMHLGIEHTCKYYFFTIMSRTPVGKLKYQSIRHACWNYLICFTAGKKIFMKYLHLFSQYILIILMKTKWLFSL